MRLPHWMAATALIAMSPVFAGTIVLFNELNAPVDANDFILEDGPLYASFSTGSTPVMLSDVMAKLTVKHDEGFAIRKRGHSSISWPNFVNLPRLSALGVTIGLYADQNRNPGALISTIGFLADSALPSAQQYKNFDFPVNPPVQLAANTRYWLGFSTTSGGQAGLAFTQDTKGPEVSTEFYVYQGSVYPDVNGPYQISVTATTPDVAVPTIQSVFDQAAASSGLTPGMPIQIVGTGFGAQAPAIKSGPASRDASALPTVMIGTETAPILLFANAENIVVQVPVDAPLGQSNVTVTAGGQTSAQFPIKIVAIAPEIEPFQAPGGSSFYDTAGNPLTDAHPAIPNEEIYLLGIGLGTTNPPMVTNTPATEAAPTTQAVEVMVGNKMVTPDYAGLYVGGSPGLYQVSFRVPADAAMGSQPVTIMVGGVTSNSVNLSVGPPIPIINAVVNGATFAPGPAPQAANSFVSLFGLNFGSDNTGGNIFPATSFKGLSVLVNGTTIPLYVVAGTGGQINIVLPSELGTSGNASVQVVTSEGTSDEFQVALTKDSVGIFRIQDPSKASRENGAVLFTNTAWKVMPLSMAKALGLPDCATVTTASICGKPAKIGDQIEIYLTGLGKATPNGDPNGTVLPTGSLAPTDGSVLYKTVDQPVVKIGGVQATVSFSGIAPGNAGQYQINVQVPDGVKPSDDVTLEITMPDGSTDTVTIAITAS